MKLFNDLLQSHGFNTIQSIDGKDTLLLAKEHRPDLIIMDIRLPVVSGIEHTKILKADDDLKHIPVLAVTAFAMTGDKERIIEAGCDGYLSKPISIPSFFDEIKRFLTLGDFRLIEPLIIGHAAIDLEHKKLAIKLNEFMGFLDSGDLSGCADKIDEINIAIKDHFQYEEIVMEELGYNGCETHTAGHSSIISSFEELVKEAARDGYSGSFPSKLSAVLVRDMIREDTGFKVFLQSINYQEPSA